MELALGILLIVASVFLIVSVLMQGGKSNNRLSGAIAGGAETFFGKSKADTMEKKLSKVTAVVAVVFAVLVLVVYLMQDTVNYSDYTPTTPTVSDTTDSATNGDAAESDTIGLADDGSVDGTDSGAAEDGN